MYRKRIILATVVGALLGTSVALAEEHSSRNCGQVANGGYCNIPHNGITKMEGNANNPAGSVECKIYFAGGGEESSSGKPRCSLTSGQPGAGDESRVYNRHGSSEELGILTYWQ